MIAAARWAAAPLSPDPDDARELLERELEDPAYDAAEPNALDRVARAVGDFFDQLFSSDVPEGWGPAFAVVVIVVVVALVVTALLIWGRPRRTARRSEAGGALFGVDDARTAAQLRADAAAAATAERWDAAVVLRFRALARALAERALVEPAPGATAQAFARDAARPFPAAAGRFADAATLFDDVRYLRRPATGDTYERLAALDDEVAATRPVLAGTAS